MIAKLRAVTTMLAKAINAMPAADDSSVGTSSVEKAGMRSCGSPAGTSPMILTPLLSRPSTATTSAAAIIVTSAAGRRGTSRGASHNRAKLPAPMASVGQWVKPSLEMTSRRRGTIPPASTEKPSTLPICPSTMLSAMPFMNPTRIGRDRKSASAPSLRKLPATQRRPAMKASVNESEA